jgi:mannose-6-phosphate isomerase
MSEFYKLRNQVRHYDWGSPVDIPRLMGVAINSAPWAELWMGSHSGAPSMVDFGSCETSLGDLISGDPEHFLGEEIARRYGELPFLLKLLGVEKALSIQAHPNLAMAREGFERENRAGLALDSPERNYKDPNHKPEIICALTPFTGLCGFRAVDEISGLFTVFFDAAPPVLREGIAPLMRALAGSDPLRGFLTGVFGLSQALREALTGYVLSLQEPPAGCELELMQGLARLYPGDPAVIAPLYLNFLRLEPGEAFFMEPGVLHSYVHGFGVELMANSDNVLRGGLTGKYVNVPELMKVLDFRPFKPNIIAPNANCFSYTALCEEFHLARIRGSGPAEPWPPVEVSKADPGSQAVLDGPSICVVTEGELVIAASDRETVVKRGESVFIPPIKSDGSLSLKGNFTLFAAFCGCAASIKMQA